MRKLRDVNMPAYHKERHDVFGNCPTFIDAQMLILGLFTLDIFALESFVEARHGKIPDMVSLEEFVREHYGEPAVRFVLKWIGAETSPVVNPQSLIPSADPLNVHVLTTTQK